MWPYLVDSISHSLQRELSRAVHCLAVICGAPAGTVDVNNLRHVADRGGLDDVSHEGLVQHSDACTTACQFVIEIHLRMLTSLTSADVNFMV